MLSNGLREVHVILQFMLLGLHVGTQRNQLLDVLKLGICKKRTQKVNPNLLLSPSLSHPSQLHGWVYPMKDRRRRE